MTPNDVFGIIGATIGAGLLGLAATLTKYWLDRRKMESENDQQLLTQLQCRIADLESQHADCIQKTIEMSKRIGYLEAKMEPGK